jgi:pyruvate dehydrogenase E1 component alpha subunit
MQILDEQGNVDAELEPKVPREELLKLYRAMVLARELDQRMLKMQRQGRIGTFGPCTGQEAAHCAPTLAMAPNDWFVGAFREMGARLMLGEKPSQVLVYYNGYEEGSTLPESYKRMLPLNIIVGSQTLHAAGIAYALKYKKENAAAICYLGDGATSEGDFHEALNFAAVFQVPAVFISQNNQWAISLPRSAQTKSVTLAQKGIAYEMPCLQVDGNDALAMYRATKEALDRARSGGGPTFIEAVTYRLMMHTTADDPARYRTKEEEESWWKKDPIPRFRIYLEKKKYWSAKQQTALEAEILAEVEAAVVEFETPREYKPDLPFDNVFGTRHEILDEQRAEFLEELKKDAANG